MRGLGVCITVLYGVVPKKDYSVPRISDISIDLT